ncbi:MAG: thermonuclease family protein [Sphingobium sp.]
MILSLLLSAAMPASACRVIDGDTLRLGKERLRIVGIDAPDDPRNSRCRPYPKPGAVCDARKAVQSKAALQRMMRGKVRIDQVGRDRYGRVLAHAYVDGRSVACQQIRAGQAHYVRRWDERGRLARECF